MMLHEMNALAQERTRLNGEIISITSIINAKLPYRATMTVGMSTIELPQDMVMGILETARKRKITRVSAIEEQFELRNVSL